MAQHRCPVGWDTVKALDLQRSLLLRWEHGQRQGWQCRGDACGDGSMSLGTTQELLVDGKWGLLGD